MTSKQEKENQIDPEHIYMEPYPKEGLSTRKQYLILLIIA